MSNTYPDLRYSNFPDQIDNQIPIRDPSVNDMALIHKYNSLLASGQYAAAIEILSANPSLQESQMNAEKLLKIHHSILALQRFFYDNVQEKIFHLGQQKGEWNQNMSSTATGSDLLNMYDIVRYPVDGLFQYFMVISNDIVAGERPTTTDKYMQLTIKGEQGDAGIGMNPRGDWDATKTYDQYDLVSHAGLLWYSLTPNAGQEPSEDSNVWRKFTIENPSKVKRYTYSLTADREGQTRFVIPMTTFDYKRDVVFVQSGITSLFQGQDFEVVSDGILLTEGVPIGRTIGIYVLKNVEDTTIEPGTINGALIEDGSISLNKLAEDISDWFAPKEHINDFNNPHKLTKEQIGAADAVVLEDHIDNVNNPHHVTPEQIGAGRVNPNLLDNWYFGNPINQRGKMEYTAIGYTIDRWKKFHAIGTVRLGDGHMEIVGGDSESLVLHQYIDNGLTLYNDKTLTLSILTTEGLASVTVTPAFTEDWGSTEIEYIGNAGVGLQQAGGITNPDEFSFLIRTRYGTSANIIAMKLELGEEQTLAHQDANGNWVLNEIPDYGEQLGRCQRYYWRSVASNNHTQLPMGIATSATNVCVLLPVAMRAKPVVSFNAGERFVCWNNADEGWSDSTHEVTDVSVERYNGSWCSINLTTTGLVRGKVYRVQTRGGYIELSADL